ncbi:MAG TPA: NAD(P)-binding domain-containing protein [Gemmatimonadaceae bacterium]|nr:NAD(P)-binding domain-containing protein [Gemmatimonadaceae bacterium]
MSDTGDRRSRYCIIGAGPSGLAVARAFKNAGVPFDVLERHDGIGGIWDFSNPRTPMYDTAHFISSRTLSAFDGYPMPDHYPDYPGWREILAYIRGFADAHGLAEHVETGADVTRVVPEDGELWRVELATGEVRRYAGIVAAVGHDWLPNETVYPGQFTGESYHSVRYRLPSEFAGKRVLVVGGGNSGCDIASDAAVHAKHGFISLRRGYHFLPKHLFGKPTDVFFRSGPQPHARIAQPILSMLLRLVVGDLTRYGLRAPDHKPLESHPIVNSQLLHHLAHGNITPKVDVAGLDGRLVRFVDGSTEEVDLIVYATGYRREIPFLSGALGTDGAAPALWAHAFAPGHPTLFVAGHFDSDGGAYPLFCKQAELFAELARSAEARSRLGERMRSAAPDLTGGIRHIDSARHDVHVNTEAYGKFIVRLLREAR